MRRYIPLLVCLLSPVQLLWSQPSDQKQEPPAATFRSAARLVNIDVLVLDKKGRPVTDLKKEDFTVLERGKPQSISSFSLHTQQGETNRPEPVPAGVFTNRPPAARESVYTVVLLDGLNTRSGDQMFARQQMLKFLKNQRLASQNLAIFALSQNLMRLQDFTSDPQLLQAALDRAPLLEHLRDEPAANAELDETLPDFVRNAVDRFEQEKADYRLEVRVNLTLNSLARIGNWLASFPGRKNLLWLSASFPIQLNPSSSGGLGTQRNYTEAVRRVASILSSAQVAVYPIDARGLVGLSTTQSAEVKGSAAISNTGLRGGVGGGGLDLAEAQSFDAHDSMREIAEATGGKALYNRNDVDNAILLSLLDSSTYYEVGYVPTDPKWDGEFRKVDIKVNRPNVVIRHRNGYFAQETNRRDDKESAKRDILLAIANPLEQTGLVFYALVLKGEDQSGKRTADVRFIVPFSSFATRPGPDKTQQMDLSFIGLSLDGAGKAKSSAEDRTTTALNETQMKELTMGFPFRLAVTLPDDKVTRLKLLVRDNITGILGTLTIPRSTLSAVFAGSD